jgi:hypothetical protein
LISVSILRSFSFPGVTFSRATSPVVRYERGRRPVVKAETVAVTGEKWPGDGVFAPLVNRLLFSGTLIGANLH